MRDPVPDLHHLFALAADPLRRAEASRELARCIGGDQVIVFIEDPETGIHVAGPGFPQSLPGRRIWSRFLEECLRIGLSETEVPNPDSGRTAGALGLAATDGSVLVVIGGSPDREKMQEACRLVPLLAAVLTREREARAEAERVQAARDVESPFSTLAGASDVTRTELQAALQETASTSERVTPEQIDRKRAQEELRKQTTLLQTITDNATTALLMMDTEGRGTFWNRAAEDMMGYTAEETIGKVLHELIHHHYPDGRPFPIEECPIDRALPEGFEVRGYEDVFIRKDGSFFPVLCSARPILENGRPAGTVIEVVDITEQKRTEAMLREQTHVLKTLNDVNARLAAELDLDRLVQAVTDAGTELTHAQFGAFFYNLIDERGESYMLYTLSGAPREAFEGFPMPRNTEVFHPTFSGEAIVRSGDVTTDSRYGRNPPYHGMPEGHLPVRSYLAVPVIARSGDVLGGLFFGHEEPDVFDEQAERSAGAIADQASIAVENARLYRSLQVEVAERSQAEARLKELNETLELHVARRTAELEQANEALRQTNRDLFDFAYVASHDLREPLRKILTFTDLAREEHADDLPGELPAYLERIDDAAGRMMTLLDALLTFARITTQPEPFVPVDLSEATRDVLADLEVRLMETGGSVDVGPLPTVEASPSQMRQLLQNLIGNALKFHRPEVPPRVIVHAEFFSGADPDDETEHVRLIVEDNGVGFDERYAGRIFQPFQRLHARVAYEGTGLGLAICRRIVERHGGAIRAESKPGVGSRFIVDVPRRQAHRSEAV